MSKAKPLIFAVATLALGLATAATAGPFRTEEKEDPQPGALVPFTPRQDARADADRSFVFVGGDAGWQLQQHVFVWSGNRFVHSDECDHAIRTAKAATPGELDAARRLYPGG